MKRISFVLLLIVVLAGGDASATGIGAISLPEDRDSTLWSDTVDVAQLILIRFSDSAYRRIYEPSFSRERSMRASIDSLGVLMGGERVTGLFELMYGKLTSSRLHYNRFVDWSKVIEEAYDLPESLLYDSPLIEEARQLTTSIINIEVSRRHIIYLAVLEEYLDLDSSRYHIAGLMYVNEHNAWRNDDPRMRDIFYDIREITDSATAARTLRDAGLDALLTDIASLPDRSFPSISGEYSLGRFCLCNALRWELLMRRQR